MTELCTGAVSGEARAGRNHAAPAGLLGLVRPDAARGAGLGRAALLFTGEERGAPFIPGLNGTPALPARPSPPRPTGKGTDTHPSGQRTRLRSCSSQVWTLLHAVSRPSGARLGLSLATPLGPRPLVCSRPATRRGDRASRLVQRASPLRSTDRTGQDRGPVSSARISVAIPARKKRLSDSPRPSH